MDRHLPAALLQIATTQRGALTGSQIAGVIGGKQLMRLVRYGVVTKLWRNAYALPGRACDAPTRLKAAEMTMGRPVTACLQTAAELYGFDLNADRRTHVLADHNWPNATPGIIQHRYRPVRGPSLLESMTGLVGPESLDVADLAETAVRMACRETDPARRLAVLDRALARTVVDREDLAGVAGDLHIRGISLTRELIELADGRAESLGESWLRWVCIEAGLPPATPQIAVVDDYGRRYRVGSGLGGSTGRLRVRGRRIPHRSRPAPGPRAVQRAEPAALARARRHAIDDLAAPPIPGRRPTIAALSAQRSLSLTPATLTQRSCG